MRKFFLQKISLSILILVIFIVKAGGQITSTTTGGDWHTSSTWIGGVVPGTNNVTIVVDGPVTSSVDLTFNNNVSLTVSANDTLIVYGDLTFNNGANLYIESGAVVIVRGNFVSNNNLNLAADAYFIVMGNFTLNNNSDVTSATTPSQIFIGGAVNWGNGTTGNVLDCSGTSGYDSNCNYGNIIDLINDSIFGIISSTCTPAPSYYSYGEPASNSPVSVGNTINLTANPNPGSGATFVSYAWEGPNGFTYTSYTTSNTSIGSATMAMTGEYVFIAFTDAGCYLQDTIYVLVSDCCPSSGYASRDNYTGNWEDVSTWTTTTLTLPPPTNGSSSQTVCINGIVTVNGDLTITNTSYTVCDTLIITGNLDVGSYALNVAANGVLIVLGNYTGTNGTSDNSGKVIIAGEVNENYTLGGSGSTYIFDSSPTGNFLGGFTSAGDESALQTNDPDLYNFYMSVSCGTGVSGGTVGSGETICAGVPASEITNITAPGPGSGFSYLWYKSTDSSDPATGTWTTVTDSVREALFPDTLYITTYFYRKATVGGGCTANSNVVTKTVNPLPTVVISATPDTICYGDYSDLSAGGGITYVWSPSTNLDNPNISGPRYSPGSNPLFATPVTVTYTVTVTDANSCTKEESIDVVLRRTPETGPTHHIGNTWGN